MNALGLDQIMVLFIQQLNFDRCPLAQMKHFGYQQRPIALFTPGGGGAIARDVRLATIKDAYEPMDLGVYQDAVGLL